MTIGHDKTLPGHSLSPAARNRWGVGIGVTILVAVIGGGATIVGAALDGIREATKGAYEIERARIDRMETDLAQVKAEIGTFRVTLASTARDLNFLVEAEKRRQRLEDLGRLNGQGN